jgi:hypothetical protein
MISAEMNTERITEREPLERSAKRIGVRDSSEIRELEQSADRLQYALFQMARGY